MAAEARAESPAAPVVVPAAPVVVPAAASPEKRVLSGDAGKEERPEPKRRRACVAALDSVPCAAPPLVDGGGDGSSFSFQHARGGFVVLETTPKFGSFNPPAAAAVAPKPAPPAGQDSPPEEEGELAREEADAKDGNSQVVGPGGQGQKT